MLIHYVSAAIQNKDIETLATLQASTDMLYVGTGFIMVTKYLKERVMRCKTPFCCFEMVHLTRERKGRGHTASCGGQTRKQREAGNGTMLKDSSPEMYLHKTGTIS